jgi:hypothetical protein
MRDVARHHGLHLPSDILESVCLAHCQDRCLLVFLGGGKVRLTCLFPAALTLPSQPALSLAKTRAFSPFGLYRRLVVLRLRCPSHPQTPPSVIPSRTRRISRRQTCFRWLVVNTSSLWFSLPRLRCEMCTVPSSERAHFHLSNIAKRPRIENLGAYPPIDYRKPCASSGQSQT